MKADLVIRGARVIDHMGEFQGGVAVSGGKIIMAASDDALPPGHREIDAEGRCLMPGAIDPHCHLGVNYPFDEDMRTETAAAARGNPVVDGLEMLLHQARPGFALWFGTEPEVTHRLRVAVKSD